MPARIASDAQDGVAPALDYPALYARHWAPLLCLAQSLVDDVASAEDVVQESFAALFRSRG